MLCKAPYRLGIQEMRCGRCMPCRVYRRDVWVARCLLESTCYPFSSFVTLTYGESCPVELKVRDVQLFLKRLRLQCGKVRYLMVGEYGSRFGRPHYHGLLFGVPAPRGVEWVQRAWPLGRTQCVPISSESVQYCIGYVTKGMTQSDDERLKGRRPEFMRCSLRPGLGAGALDRLEEFHYTEVGARFLQERKDVVGQVRFAGRVYPLGRYLVRLLRGRFGVASSDLRRAERFVEEAEVLRDFPDMARARESTRVAHSQIAEGRVRLLAGRKRL